MLEEGAHGLTNGIGTETAEGARGWCWVWGWGCHGGRLLMEGVGIFCRDGFFFVESGAFCWVWFGG